jgi:hypothetical protein
MRPNFVPFGTHPFKGVPYVPLDPGSDLCEEQHGHHDRPDPRSCRPPFLGRQELKKLPAPAGDHSQFRALLGETGGVSTYNGCF